MTKLTVCLFIALLFLQTPGASIDKEIHSFSAALFSKVTIDSQSTVAILPFMKKEGTSDVGLAVAEMLIAEARTNYNITLVDRQNLKTLLDEQALSLSGVIDEAHMLQVGKMASANFILTGKVIPSAGTYLVSGQLTNAETGEIISAATMSLPKNNAEQASSSLFEQKNYPLHAAFRSTLIPGWGQAACDEKKHAILFATLSGAGLTATFITGIGQKNAYDEHADYHSLLGTPAYVTEKNSIANELGLDPNDMKIDTIFNERLADKYASYEDKRKLFVTSLAITGAIWTSNIIDAILMGKRADKKFKLYFAGNPYSEQFATGLTLSF